METGRRPILDGVRALVVDDEPMNLVVATGLFKEYNMIIDTAKSGRESIQKFATNDYDIIFMDHMMPEMDGIEAMKHLREEALQKSRSICIVALTANAVSGAREMFLREGFDGFISKPINLNDFERTIGKLMPLIRSDKKGGLL
jgi:CheY-like chemotaxis protein